MGHSKAVHDITFNNDGTKFLSAAFDRQMKLWDTETGASLSCSVWCRLTNCEPRTMPTGLLERQDPVLHQVPPRQAGRLPRWNVGQKDHSGLALSSSPTSLVVDSHSQYDMNSGEITQEYDQHLGPVRPLPPVLELTTDSRNDRRSTRSTLSTTTGGS